MSTRVWDLPVRLAHWVLAAAVLTCWWTGEEGLMDIHQVSGYVVLGVVLFRLAWGFLGSENARFFRFPIGPRTLARYLGTLLDRDASPWPGHNPLGSLMVLFMLAYFGTQATLGLFASDDLLVEGPLAVLVSSDTVEAVSDLHHELGEYVLLVVGVHVAAVLFYLFWKRQNLVRPMITGRRAAEPADHAQWFASLPRAIALAVTAAIVVVTLVQYGRSLGY